ERSLLDESADGAEKYRFLWLPTFHHPIYVRIENGHGGIRLSTKELDGAGGYEPGKVIRSRDITLDPKVWCEFLRRLDGASYWQLAKDNNELGDDGSQWVLEGVKDGRYHIVDRWTPREGEYREACIYLLRLSGLDVDALKGDLY
ncbi:MAG TPA: hypothetical protein VGQ55_10205, partial [Pyrinomonadaceae bacterium]|nr:hypothetical protein [Pyrinomonadaceae bacterium]